LGTPDIVIFFEKIRFKTTSNSSYIM